VAPTNTTTSGAIITTTEETLVSEQTVATEETAETTEEKIIMPTEETTTTVSEEWGWEQDPAEGGTKTKPSTPKNDIDLKWFGMGISILIALSMLVVLFINRIPQRAMGRLFKKKAVLTEQELQLKALYEKRLEAEKERLLRNKENPTTKEETQDGKTD